MRFRVGAPTAATQTLQGTIGTTGCFNSLGNGQISITANYVATVNTTTTVASSANPSTFGQAVTFTATVTPASGAIKPTGSVQFKIDGADFGTPVSVTPGSGNTSVATSSSTSTLPVAGSPHVITAVYSPTGAFNASTGTLNQTVNTGEHGHFLSVFRESVEVRTVGDVHGNRRPSCRRDPELRPARSPSRTARPPLERAPSTDRVSRLLRRRHCRLAVTASQRSTVATETSTRARPAH